MLAPNPTFSTASARALEEHLAGSNVTRAELEVSTTETDITPTVPSRHRVTVDEHEEQVMPSTPSSTLTRLAAISKTEPATTQPPP